MSAADRTSTETYNPWSIVNLVFTHLSSEGLHPTLGESGDPGPPARDLLTALGIVPAPEGNRQVMREVHQHLAQIRAEFDDSSTPGSRASSQHETEQGSHMGLPVESGNEPRRKDW